MLSPNIIRTHFVSFFFDSKGLLLQIYGCNAISPQWMAVMSIDAFVQPYSFLPSEKNPHVVVDCRCTSGR